MKFLREGLCLVVLGAGLAAEPGLQAVAAGSASAAPDRSLVQQLRDQSQGSLIISNEPSTGKVGFVRAAKGGDLLPSYDGTAVDKADQFLVKYAGLFGTSSNQLVQSQTMGGKYGSTVSYVQKYQGLPVFGSEIRVNFDKQGDLTSVNGYAAPDLNLSVNPSLSAKDAAARALGTVRQAPPGQEGKASTAGIKAASNDLVIYRMGSIHGDKGAARLVYVVEVSNGKNIRDSVFVDAQTGKVVNRYSMVDNALSRKLYETNYDPGNLVWQEGDAFPGTLTEDQQNEVNGTGDAYWFFKDVWGRDSYDGAGHIMETVNNDPSINCPNANWNGTTTNYCSGLAADDVVAHEWGHAYTEFTHGLIYQWQPGALNESYSDIWGETVDLINGHLDEGEGDLTIKRPVGACSTHSPATPIVVINSPAAIAKNCDAGAASFGPQLSGTGITGDVVLAVDDNAADGSTSNACSTLTNGAAVTGKVALVDRGVCAFTVKVKNAQNAGAVAVLVGDNVEASPGAMSGADATITIPSVRIRLSDRNLIVGALPSAPVNVTMKDAAGDRVDSYRWLMGEHTTAFGGAIRDMWSPTCYGDPGKVSDTQYYCATDDAGGVHTNSGVPNHGYSLLVDGGTYNSVPVDGIGLDKAANIYFRAMTVYQTPTSDFADHADSLEAACSDLIGQPINALTVAPDAAPTAAASVTAADCAAVHAMTQAVELRTAPVQCNFQPMLDPNTPAVCGSNYKQNVVWKDDFESGLGNWTQDEELGFPLATGFPWEANTTAPSGHAGGVAYGPDPSAGSCSGAAGDISSRNGLISPVIALPGSAAKAPRLTFDHSMASEAGYDGGNVKIKVNGAAAWTLIPASAYVFNPPGATMASAATNSSPLAGQVGFTGTDGGKVTSDWGQSQIDLTQVGVTPGDAIQLRFDMGRDGCGGVDGWYVDNVTVSTCKLKAKITAVHMPDRSAYGTASTVDVTVSGDGTVGAEPTGIVQLRNPAGTLVGTGTLDGGTATIALPARMKVGTSPLTASYKGDATYAAESTGVAVHVSRAASTTTGKGTPNPVERTKTITATVKVTGTGVNPAGTVKIFAGTVQVGMGQLSGGTGEIKIFKDFPIGMHTFTIKYLGSVTVAPSQGTFTVKIIS